MKQEVFDRFKNYTKDHCWQYEMRQQNLAKDLKEASLTIETIQRFANQRL